MSEQYNFMVESSITHFSRPVSRYRHSSEEPFFAPHIILIALLFTSSISFASLTLQLHQTTSEYSIIGVINDLYSYVSVSLLNRFP